MAQVIVDWQGCHNARDLDSLPVGGGRLIRRGVLFRSDSHHLLSPLGVGAVLATGVTRVLDVRSGREVEHHPSPLAGDPVYRHLPLAEELTPDRATADAYRSLLGRNRFDIARAFIIFADAPLGPVAVHSSAGRDRVGVLIAVILDVAGVPAEHIAADYALTAGCTGGTILRTLADLTSDHGGSADYLAASGVPKRVLRKARSRLL